MPAVLGKQERKAMPEWAIDHISAVTLAVRDMPESVAFYERLGLHVS